MSSVKQLEHDGEVEAELEQLEEVGPPLAVAVEVTSVTELVRAEISSRMTAQTGYNPLHRRRHHLAERVGDYGEGEHVGQQQGALDEPVARPPVVEDELQEQQDGCPLHEGFYPGDYLPWVVKVGEQGLPCPRRVCFVLLPAWMIHGIWWSRTYVVDLRFKVRLCLGCGCRARCLMFGFNKKNLIFLVNCSIC